MKSQADIIVVGAGSAGCVMGARLSENPSLDVLVLDAGHSDRHPLIRVPAGSAFAIANPKFNWMYPTAPDPSRDGREDVWPAGKAIGGGSAINGMMYIRGHRYDYALWAQSGATGWSYEDVLPFFRKIETNERGGDPQYRGTEGPMHISRSRTPNPLTGDWVEAAKQTGLEFNDDLNAALPEGVGYVDANQKNGWRHSAASAYLRPALKRSNLTLRSKTTVTRILFDGLRAIGVETIRPDGTVEKIGARRGVVLSAGAIISPKILQLSGIGSAELLVQHGIKPKIDRPAVGQNLQEHAAVLTSYHVSKKSIGANRNPVEDLFHGMNFVFRGRGPLTTAIGHAQAFVKTSDRYAAPNIQIIMSPFVYDFDENGPKLYERPGVGIAVGLTRADSRGSISLRDADPLTPPVIDYPLLGTAHEMEQLVAGIRFSRQIMKAQAFEGNLIGERSPGDKQIEDAALEQFIRDSAFPMYHVSCTCAMGSGEDAVLDNRLRVRDTEGLWVVDASSMPSLPSGNINATVLMIAEKGAEHIKQDLRRSVA